MLLFLYLDACGRQVQTWRTVTSMYNHNRTTGVGQWTTGYADDAVRIELTGNPVSFPFHNYSLSQPDLSWQSQEKYFRI